MGRLGADGDSVLPFDAASGYPEEFMQGARRFDAGGRANPILLPMIEAALSQVLEWSPRSIEATLQPLTASLAAGARALDLWVPQHHAPHFLGVYPGPRDVPKGGSYIEGLPVYKQLLAAREKWSDEACAFLK